MNTQIDARQLKVLDVPLEGINLVEASAGTGKTWTISALYLRLVLEADRDVDRILVVTYTRAATEDLRQRIRARLVEAREAFVTGQAGEEFDRGLCARFADPAVGIRRLTNAIRGFDESAILTIHGFCQRVLGDNAFESGMPFVTTLLADERDLVQEIVDDFWRREFHDVPPLFAQYLLEAKVTPDSLCAAIMPHTGKPYLLIRGPAEVSEPRAARQAYASSYAEARVLWQAQRDRIGELLRDAGGLNGNRYRKGSIPVWLGRMNSFLRPEIAHLGLFDRFEKFTRRHLAESAKRGMAPPEHEFFEACDALLDAHTRLTADFERYLQHLKTRLLDYCNAELASRKRERQLMSYDDLLNRLEGALASDRGEVLARAVRERYGAALIDEFQDTDPTQYGIFSRIYGRSEGPVFMVGDPKQAIYSFRGADIFSYLEARRDAGRRYTLDVNWRSTHGLIRAVNTLFGAAAHPFLFGDIAFQPARGADRQVEPFTESGADAAPFRFWLMERADGGPVTRGEAETRAARATAAEITRLLNLAARGEARLGARALEGGDIAVLVRSHRQGRLVGAALREAGVSSVRLAEESVFHTDEAMELERVLMAVAEPGRESLLKAALATQMLGMDGVTLYSLSTDEQGWSGCLEIFQELHQDWQSHGFIAMFRRLQARFGVAGRLLGFVDGERRLTNLLHLAELLHARVGQQRSGMDGSIKWLAERRRSRSVELEGELLRLESDEHLVRIVTIHKSKGLEYPVVFCPFLWAAPSSRETGPVCGHDPQAGYQPVLDMGSDRQDPLRDQAAREQLAEDLRLMYVALTRARCRCYTVWGAITGAGGSAPAWLLHERTRGHGGPPAAPGADVEAMADDEIRARLEALAAISGGDIAVAPLPGWTGERLVPEAGEAAVLSARALPARLPEAWSVTSYSALAGRGGTERPDYDGDAAAGAAPAADEGPTGPTFPAGARTGSCLHAILERLDFACDRPALERLVEHTLRTYGFGREWVPDVSEMLERVRSTPLDEPGSLSLRRIARTQRLNELEFYYPVEHLHADGLRQVLLRHGTGMVEAWRAQIETLSFPAVRGFMKGYIDLVFSHDGRFYLADYKSNRLGANRSAYMADRLPAVMARHAYHLQYLLYSVALHRYLGRRVGGYDYDRHFGGVYYLFLRGMDPACGCTRGIFHDRPARALVEALDRYLQEGGRC
jgi:exodeoxyribonuclease V beta subunit